MRPNTMVTIADSSTVRPLFWSYQVDAPIVLLSNDLQQLPDKKALPLHHHRTSSLIDFTHKLVKCDGLCLLRRPLWRMESVRIAGDFRALEALNCPGIGFSAFGAPVQLVPDLRNRLDGAHGAAGVPHVSRSRPSGLVQVKRF